jgi:hypothetical protein
VEAALEAIEQGPGERRLARGELAGEDENGPAVATVAVPAQ